MERGFPKRPSSRAGILAILLISLLGFGVGGINQKALGAVLDNRSVTLTNSLANAASTYNFQFDIVTPDVLGSIEAEFCSNSPILSIACVAPNGFDITGASLGAQTGETGFSISPLTTTNKLILTRPPSADTAETVSYILDNVLNPSSVGSYYIRLQTFATSDATGANTDFGGLAYAINSGLQISTEVPPYLLFCAGVVIPAYNCSNVQGSLVELGGLGPNKTSSGQSQLLVSTNAQNGYTLYMDGTTLTSGNKTISSLNIPATALAGSDQFGVNLRANLSPAIGQEPAGPGAGVPTVDYNQPNKYKFVNNDVIATSPSFEDFRRYTVSYIADVSGSQPAGVYVSTITYVCVGNF